MPSWGWSALALMVLIGANVLFTPGFATIQVKDGHLYGTLIDILERAAPVMLVALGMTLVIATGGVDLSVGAIIAISGTVAALGAGRLPLPILLLCALGTSLALGLWNGLLVAALRIQPIVATLVLMVLGRGIAQLLSNGQIITFDDPALSFFGRGFLFGLPFALILVAGAALLIGLLVRATGLGSFIEATGDNPTAARFVGLPVSMILLFAYAATGLFAGLAGLVIAAETRAADANNAGLYLELDAILAVVLGGTMLRGGRMSLVGSLLGAVLIQALSTTILTRGLQVEWTLAIKAVVILAVCLIQSDRLRQALLLRRRTA